ncbi:hypothetical protein AMECASPLE_029244, partial [Ameca splendens]
MPGSRGRCTGRVALSPNPAALRQPSCPFWRHLSQKEKQRQLSIFSSLEGEFPIVNRYLLDEALEAENGRTSAPTLRTEDQEIDRGEAHPAVMNNHDAQHSKRNKNVQGETENTSSSAGSNAVTPELTLVLIGNKDCIEIGSKNILLDHDKEIHEKEFSSRLYDLFARQISVINMLGFPSIETVPVIKDNHAFILLISNGLHDSQYTSGMQWLERKFGKEHSSYVMTVVTHDSDDICESALQDLKAKSSFSEKRYHTCTRSMMDENEIIALLKKIDDLVSENRWMTEGQEAHHEALRTVKETETDDEFEDAVEDFEKDDNCKARQAEVSLGQYQPTDK